MRYSKPFSFSRAASSVAAAALVLTVTLWMGTAGQAQPPAPAPTPTPPPPQKPLPTQYAPPLKDASGQVIVTPADKQSPVNPFPSGAGNAQARGVGSVDPFWGIVNGNVPWNQIPLSRVPNFGATNSSTNNIPLQLDGWSFTAGLLGFDPTSADVQRRDPRANDPRSGSRNGVFLNQVASLVIDDQDVYAANTGAVTAVWLTVQGPPAGTSGPSENAYPDSGTTANDYTRAPALPRPNTPALQYITQGGAANPHGFRYQFNSTATTAAAARTRVPGSYGTQLRLRVSIHVPTVSVDDNLAATEGRISDARYFVFYYIKSASTGAILPKVKIYTISQLSGGDIKLLNDNGVEPVFPFYSYNTEIGATPAGVTPITLPVQPGLGIVFQGVIVDDTTGDTNTGTGLQYVLADSLNLTGSTGTISATPTIVGPHGGRKNANYNLTPDIAGVPIAPGPVGGTQPQQPRPFVPRLGAPYANQIVNDPLVVAATGAKALTNDSFRDVNLATGNRDTANTPGFVNNPRDLVYDPTDLTGVYDKTVPFESWNPSTLFMGPESLIDPRRKTNPNDLNEPGLPLRVGAQNRPLIDRTDPITGGAITNPGTGTPFRTPANASDANNFDVYGSIYDTTTSTLLNWMPYYSQMQVIVARTEFVPDPETAISDDQKDGTLTLQVGSVYALDWQTGAPIWRFPDKTYLPGRSRNPLIFTGIPADPDPAKRQDVFLIPGIVVVDKNLDGSNVAIDPRFRTNGDRDIEDEEVFIGEQIGSARTGSQISVGSGSGALFASITYAPRVSVQGRVQLPTYEFANPPVLTQFNRTGRYLLTDTGTTVAAPEGRYFTHTGNNKPNTNDGRGPFAPVLTGMLYVAASNGVVYAIDAFGNNDNFYSAYHPDITNPALIDRGVFGNYQPGTTNVLWTFSPTSGSQRRGESQAAYYTRLKNEVPATSSFGASAPVLAYRKDEHDNTSANPVNRINPLDPATPDELRLFVGNQNGVLYALDASANAGVITNLGTVVDVRALPVRKGDQVGFVPDDATTAIGVALHRSDLKWWFRSRGGAINYPPTVSLMKQNAGGSGGVGIGALLSKGVYFSSQEGRVYCVDFDGPVTRQNHTTPVTGATGWDGTATVAALLNDDYFFHNSVPATPTTRADLTEGDVRPRWAWPNLYRNTRGGTAKTVTVIPDFGVPNGTRQTDAYDANSVAPINLSGSVRLGVPEALGAPTSSPVLMDFLWKDPLVLGSAPQLRSYVAVVMNDPLPTGGTVTGTRVYLLDQVGDRENFLTGTQANKTGANAPIAVRGQYADRWTPGVVLSDGDVNGTTPNGLAWTYRTQYDVYPANSTLLQNPLTNPADLSGRNSPTTNPQALSSLPSATAPANAFTGTDGIYPHYRDENYGRPERRTLPTLYVGGGGQIHGLDIDPETGLFMRWRPDINETARLVVLPVDPRLTGTGSGDDLYPGPDSTDDQRPIIVGPDKYNDPFFGSTVRTNLRDRRVLARSMNMVQEDTGTVAALTISGGPLQNRNNITNINGTTPTLPTVPTYPTNDAPLLRPFLLTGDPTQNPPSYDPDIYAVGQTDVRQYAHSSRVNQDINDPITTTRGSLYSDVPLDPQLTRFIQLETTSRVFNQAYQYPALFAVTTSGFLHEVSSNIEGEDFSTVATLGFSHTVGWGFQGLGTLERRFNTEGHVQQFTQDFRGGSHGAVAGIAVVSPVYFPALDPAFVNPDRVAAQPTAVPTDNYPNYPFGSPNVTGAPSPGVPTPPTPVGVTVGNNDDPRPDFHVRPLSPGVVVRPGPDGLLGTTDDLPYVLPDRHTGQTGFPLDLNGLFFDKRFAGNGTRTLPLPEVGSTVYNETVIDAQATAPVTPIVGQNLYTGVYPYPALNAGVTPNVLPAFTGQDPNGDYTVGLRLPAYSDIGTALDTATAPVARLFNNQQADGIRANRRTGNLVPRAGETPTTLELPYLNDPLVNAVRGDDINPAAQNVAWIYTGAANGICYAYTPAIPGQESGFSGGQPEVTPGLNGSPLGGEGSAAGGNFQVDLFDQANYNLINSQVASGGLTAPDRALSIAAKGGKNFYEWGETAYIVISNITISRSPNPADPGNSLPLRLSPNARVHVIIRSRLGGAGVAYDGTVAPARYNGNYATYPITEPDGTITNYGVVLLPFKLDRPTLAKPLTPGDLLEVTASIVNTDGQNEGLTLGNQGISNDGGQVSGAGSGLDQQTANSPASSFSIANPLAVQGFAAQTAPTGASGQLLPVGLPRANNGDTTGGVGPFFSDNNQMGTGNGTKGEIYDSQTGTRLDPDKVGARYSQALTNGQTLRRRELSALILDSASPNGYRLNPRFPQILKDASGGDEPFFYFPVAAGVGYVDHGTTGSTTKGKLQGLRVANRSVLTNLPNVRIQAVDPLLWHAWPGLVPNTEGDLPAVGGTNPSAALIHNNPRFTPVGMDLYGRINPLPWETGVNENEPYNPGSLANQSPDYPDILLGRTTNMPRIFAGGADISQTTGSLPANITINTNSRVNNSVGFVQNLYGPNFGPALADNMAVSVSLPIPKYQSANLVAIHTLTSIYQIANQADDPAGASNAGLDIIGGAGTPGPVQLPRGYNARLLHESNTAGTAFNGPQAIAPWGYSTKMVAYVDLPDAYPGSLYPPGTRSRVSGVDNTTNTGVIKAFREFEVWVGVPVAMSLQMVEKEVDLGNEGHGFAIQNGLLGYGSGGGAYASGFLPTPLYNAAAFPAVGNITPSAPYSNYFKPFTVQNTGNINLWNLRASQKIERATTIADAGSGQPFSYFGMRSDSVDDRFGILAIGADPMLPYMPQVSTSLDPAYDNLWDNYVKALPAYQAQYNGAGSDPYTRYYAGFAGHHPLHKPLPGATSPTVLGVPDVPSAQSVYDIDPNLAGAAIPAAPGNSKTVVGVAVPIGTPSGLYRSNLANTPLVVFEDHDTTANGYQAVPIITGSGTTPTISPAGPLYGGRNNAYFADINAPGGAVPVQARNGASDGTLRARRFNTASGKLEYQPYTDPTFDLRVTVKETGLTGQAADRALAALGSSYSLPPSIATGVLPGADVFPIIQTITNGNQITGGDLYRAASALTPAAFRSANGAIHVYYSRNVDTTSGNGDTLPGRPYSLFASHLNWNPTIGVFTADNIGVPIAGDARNNTSGRWFTTPAVITPTGAAVGSSNVTPYVLQEQLFDANGNQVPGAATLFFMNSTPTVGGAPVNVPVYAALDANGGAVSAPVPYFANASPTLQRYAPRAVYVPATNESFQPNVGTTLLFFYGGVPGRWSIYYSPRAAGEGGTPTDATPDDTNGRAELPLALPAAIVSASDPTPIVRRVVRIPGQTPVTTIDMYYTGVSRATQTPDVYMTRYELQDAGGGARTAGRQARLAPVTLPRVYGEKLTAPGREPVWQGRHISWARDLGGNSLPVIYLTDPATGGVRQVTNRSNWRYDNGSGLLYQTFLYNASVPQSLTTIYVDASAGTVRFRGAGTPRNTDSVYADYLPQTYRITTDGAGNAGTFSLLDQSILPATLRANPVNAVIKRSKDMYADRQYIFYQKGAQAGKPATLYYSARRVGIDLKSVGLRNTNGTADPSDDTVYPPLAADETIALDQPTAGNNYNSTPQITLNIAGIAIPYDVDITNSRVFVAPPAPASAIDQNASYENLPVNVTVSVYKSSTNTTRTVTYQNVFLTYLDERRDVAVPMTQAVNESQPYAFLDGFIPTVRRTNPNPTGDPTLQPGRVWLFWSTPRGREGTIIGPGAASGGAGGANPIFDPFPSAYDVFWQTLAPQFDPLLYTIPR